MTAFTTPIVFIVFNRPEPTRLLFEAIAEQKPTRLLIIADGPRTSRTNEGEACQLVREIVSRIDWQCELSTNFSPTNLGCKNRLISGLNWAFSLVEEAIVLEDDCLPDPTFFAFCKELLERYRNDDRVSMIAGTNFAAEATPPTPSYFFSQVTHIWGWATWRRAWSRYDEHLANWPAVRAAGLLKQVFESPKVLSYWTNIFDQMHAGTGPNTWDYQWAYTNLVNHALIVVPHTNLITNIGFGAGATHTVETDPEMVLPRTPIKFPLVHPPAMIPMKSLDRIDQKIAFFPSPSKQFKITMQNMRRRIRRISSFGFHKT